MSINMIYRRNIFSLYDFEGKMKRIRTWAKKEKVLILVYYGFGSKMPICCHRKIPPPLPPGVLIPFICLFSFKLSNNFE
jgi:hypothetical protein